MIGKDSDGGPVVNSFWDIQTSGQSTSVKGIGKTTAEMKNILTFSNAGWDIAIDSAEINEGYPFLSWQVNDTNPVWYINAHCGDGLINLPGEECDDGNTINGDGCSENCNYELSTITSINVPSQFNNGTYCPVNSSITCTRQGGCSNVLATLDPETFTKTYTPSDFNTYDCADCPKVIPASGTGGSSSPPTISTITVPLSPGCVLEDVDIYLNITHAYVDDLDVFLSNSNILESEMFTDMCGWRDHDIDIILDDDNLNLIDDSDCFENSDPYSPLPTLQGTYATEFGSGLTVFDGEDPSGIWTLTIYDDVGGDIGTLNDWNLIITYSCPGQKGIIPEQPLWTNEPFYTTDNNPQSCGFLTQGQSCNNQWNVYATSEGQYDFYTIYSNDLLQTPDKLTDTINAEVLPYADLDLDGIGDVCDPQTCGNGIQEGTEQCDPPTSCIPPYNGTCPFCNSTCYNDIAYGPYCGDGIIDLLNEECDDGNSNNNDDCLNDCTNPSCGDGYVWNQGTGTEQCDDNNTLSGDGCDETCFDEYGACCRSSGCINNTAYSFCTAPFVQGVYQGTNTTCQDGNRCPGACCTTDSCLNIGWHECNEEQGDYRGYLTNCSQLDICPRGACCLNDESQPCLELTQFLCNNNQGYFRGLNHNCSEYDVCPEPPLQYCDNPFQCNTSTQLCNTLTGFCIDKNYTECQSDFDCHFFMNSYCDNGTCALAGDGNCSNVTIQDAQCTNGSTINLPIYLDTNGYPIGNSFSVITTFIETYSNETPVFNSITATQPGYLVLNFNQIVLYGNMTRYGINAILNPFPSMMIPEGQILNISFSCTADNLLSSSIKNAQMADYNHPGISIPMCPLCGNGQLDNGEECDDGNYANFDGCDYRCYNEVCGNNILQPLIGEECDDGNTDNNDGCSSSCKIEEPSTGGGGGSRGGSKVCTVNYVCTDWGSCLSTGLQTRFCYDENYCGIEEGKPIEMQECDYIPLTGDECLIRADCDEDEVCENGYCVRRACTTREDCPSDMTCKDGECAEWECSFDNDCDEDEYCKEHLCIKSAREEQPMPEPEPQPEPQPINMWIVWFIILVGLGILGLFLLLNYLWHKEELVKKPMIRKRTIKKSKKRQRK